MNTQYTQIMRLMAWERAKGELNINQQHLFGIVKNNCLYLLL